MNEISKTTTVIVIGGGSFQGKSLIALKIAYDFKIPNILCTDMIRNILHALNPSAPYYSTSTYLMKQEDLEIQMRKVSNVIRNLLVIYEKRGENLIIEGMHLSKDFINYLSKKDNVIMFALNNELSFEKRLRYKSLTRKKVEYFDPKTNCIKYGPLTEDNIPFTRYVKHVTRINEIHLQISEWYKESGAFVINFENIEQAYQEIKKIIKTNLPATADNKRVSGSGFQPSPKSP